MEQLIDSGGVREGTSPPSTGVGALHAPLGGPTGPSHQGNGFGKFLTYALVPQVEERASELQEELKTTKRKRDEVLLRREASEKELHKVRSNLVEVQ
ncbi:hypothetical protein BHE74_00055716 [Ensete ventricosum]|nr:hypothetical protein BHE74_00055716 [Ensete ventricosum]